MARVAVTIKRTDQRNNWLQVFPGREFGYKPYQARVSGDTSEPARIMLLWRSKWRKASNGKGYQRKLSVEQFEQFVLPHLSRGSRGPAANLSFYAIFNYILCFLYLGCQ
jgi:hypothetical protein